MKICIISELIEMYGLDRILEDNQMSLVEAVDILVELGYLNLEQYMIEEQEDYYEEY